MKVSGNLMKKYVIWASKGVAVLYRVICETWREILSQEFLSHQKCKACGRRDKFDFYVPDEVWESVVPIRLQERVVCLACFDRLAKERGVDYAPHLTELHFAGDKASFLLRICDRAST